MTQTNMITFKRKDYQNDTLLYAKVAQQIQILMEGGYICTIFDADEKGGSIVIEFEPKNPLLGTPYPFWLTPDEVQMLAEYQSRKSGDGFGPDELWPDDDSDNGHGRN